MKTITEKSDEIKRINTEIINNLECLDKNQFNSPEIGVLIRSIEMMNNVQIQVIKQFEQNTKLLETLSETVNVLLDKSNGKYKFI